MSGRSRIPEFLDSRHIKVVRLSVLRTGRLYPPGGSLVLISVRDGVDPKAIARPEVLSQRKISGVPIGNRTRDPKLGAYGIDDDAPTGVCS